MKRISVEDHVMTDAYLSYVRSNKGYPRMEIYEDDKRGKIERWYRGPNDYREISYEESSRKLDLGEGRLKRMDAAGIDMQVLSLSAGIDQLNAVDATEIVRLSNNEMAKAVRQNPTRLAAYAALAPQDPVSAANELERAVKELGMVGAKLNANVAGEHLDESKFWIIFEMAAKLDVPVFIHPWIPAPDSLKAFLAYPGLSGSMWGFAAETSLQAIRLILSGIFDKYDGLKIILGHLGEALPFWINRLDHRWEADKAALDPRAKKLLKRPAQYIKENIYVTTSGMFWQPPFMCTYMTLGADRILFAVDDPHEPSKEAVEFMDSLPICDIDKEKIYHLNAERLLLNTGRKF